MLVVLRMLVVAALTLLLLRIGTTSGLDPPVALLLATVCVWGARPRFFIRPELFTLLLVPLALWLFSTRTGRRWWPLPLMAVVALGANLHGGMLVAPILIAAWFAGEIVGWVIHRDLDRDGVGTGIQFREGLIFGYPAAVDLVGQEPVELKLRPCELNGGPVLKSSDVLRGAGLRPSRNGCRPWPG